MNCKADRYQCLLKYWMSVSCFFAADSEEKVPRLRRLFVFGSFLREYNLYSPDFNFRIITIFLVLLAIFVPAKQ